MPYLDAANRVILPQQVTPFVTFIDKSDKPHTESQRQTKTKGEYAPNIQYITTLEGEVPSRTKNTFFRNARYR